MADAAQPAQEFEPEILPPVDGRTGPRREYCRERPGTEASGALPGRSFI